MDPNQPPRYPHTHTHNHNSSYLNYDPSDSQHLSQDPNVWSYDYIPTTTSHDTSSAIPAIFWQQNNSRFPYPPPLPSNADAAYQPFIRQHHQQTSLPSPSAGIYHTPTPDSYYLTGTAASPYAYHASPHLSYPSPVSRSMSVSAVSASSIDQANLNQRQQTQTQTQGTNTFLPTPRQIRFVSTDGQPHAKRRRINAACLTCRKRKTRCSGERPVCKTCTDNGHKCAGYAVKSQKKDGSKTHGDAEDDDDDDSRSPSPGRSKEEVNSSIRVECANRNESTNQYHRRSSGNGDGQSRYAVNEQLVDGTSPMSNHTAGSGGATVGRTRVPYFRYFGPTAIAPGFKQMVVQMKDSREVRRSQLSITSGSPGIPTANPDGAGFVRESSPTLTELPYYDAADSAPNPSLITGLCETFFANLGCNYPFLQRAGFMKDLEEKRVDAILVNAVCAVSARFSPDPILAKPSDESLPLDGNGHVKRAFRGQPFAQRAMSAVIDMFPCPTLAVTQACLLLAYEEFGSDRDSGLWMYLGTSIRMAQDLGIQKLEGLQLEGRLGPTPRTAKKGEEGKFEEQKRAEQQKQLSKVFANEDITLYEDRKASERERIDTFWCVAFLDRTVSSGVGRPVTLRDKDIEISFPYRSEEQAFNRYPDPFPSMIRIVHMYGRVADVINNIEDAVQVTPDVLKRLAAMEKDLTGIYQKLSPKLHFNATNFQYYVKSGQGTNFILLHFWFHTLIVLLHQPTLLRSFEGRIQQLFPDSRELSMSSAKTIADILAFAEFIDVNSFIGNPFTSQPMYIAACAFLAEVAAHSSQPPSRGDSPIDNSSMRLESDLARKNETERKIAAKHSLLATAANQNYQRCYQALKTLDEYWAGCRYILTALDQKSKGLADPLLFTSEDVDEMPSTEPSFTTPGWRKSSFGASLGRPGLDKFRRSTSQDALWSPKLDFGNAIGWSITGTANSPAPNLSFLYQNPVTEGETAKQTQKQSISNRVQKIQPIVRSADDAAAQPRQHIQVQTYDSSAPGISQGQRISSLPYDPVSTAEADLLLGLHSPYSASSASAPTLNIPSNKFRPQVSNGYSLVPTSHTPSQQTSMQHNPYFSDPTSGQSDNMFIESQDIDISNPSNFQFNNFNFPGGDMIPWLEYLPPDVLNYFGDPNDNMNISHNLAANGQTSQENLVLPTGPGPPHQSFDQNGSGGQEK